MVTNAIENQIVTFRSFGEILAGVVNRRVCANGSNHVNISSAAHPGHISTERLGDLHRERTHAPRRTVNQNLLPRLNLSLVAKTLQGGERRDRHRSRLLKRHVVRLHDECGLGRACILGQGAAARAEHFVTWFELRNVRAHRFNHAGHIAAQSWVLWFAQADLYANEVRPASVEPVNWIDGSIAHFDQNFIVRSCWFFNVFQLDNIRWTIVVIDDSFHEFRLRACRTYRSTRASRSTRFSRRPYHERGSVNFSVEGRLPHETTCSLAA